MTFPVVPSSPTPSLANIMVKVRKFAASPSDLQVTNQQIIDAINTYYLWNLPSNLKLLSLQRSVTFFTEPNVNVYPLDIVSYFDVQPPLYVGGYQMQYVQDKQTFYQIWPKVKNKVTAATGDGTTGPYTTSLAGTPILRSYGNNEEREVIVSALDGSSNVMTLYDIPTSATSGTFAAIGTTTPIVGSSINYLTGAITLVFPSAVLSGANINVQFTPYQASRPQTAWFFQNQFTLFPVPDDSYEIVFNAIIRPTSFLATPPSTPSLTSEPIIQEWWELLAMGAARIILQERLDIGNLQVLNQFYQEQLDNVERRTLTQLMNQSVSTLFNSPNATNLNIYNPVQGGS